MLVNDLKGQMAKYNVNLYLSMLVNDLKGQMAKYNVNLYLSMLVNDSQDQMASAMWICSCQCLSMI